MLIDLNAATKEDGLEVELESELEEELEELEAVEEPVVMSQIADHELENSNFF